MNVTVVEGDLLDQDVDVIVNAWNRNIIPWWLTTACRTAFDVTFVFVWLADSRSAVGACFFLVHLCFLSSCHMR